MSNKRGSARTADASGKGSVGESSESGRAGAECSRSVSGSSKRNANAGGVDTESGSQGTKAKAAKKQPAFNPRPVPSSTSSAAIDEDKRLPPPPPSERKIARKRESTRFARELEPDSPPQPKRQKTLAKSTSRSLAHPSASSDPLLADLRADAGANDLGSGAAIPRVDFLNFGKTAKKKPLPRPSSPPRMLDLRNPRQSMGPPTGPYVRKTRKSMRGMGFDGVMAETMVPIPDGETPMIKKNQAMRNEQARRSSLGMRGQRASSSLGRGEISIPHPSVDSTLLYKHISTVLPEPHRARHLLVYCAKRTTDLSLAPVSSKSKRKAKQPDEVRTDEGDRLVSEIMDAFMTNLGKGYIETNVFSDQDPNDPSTGLRSHPRNESNRLVKARDDAAIKRGKEQCAIWHTLISRTNRRMAETVGRLSQKQLAYREPDMTAAPAWMREALKLANDLIAQGAGELTDKGEFADVEYKIDTLHAASHAALQYTITASRFLDGVFASLSADLAPANRHSTLPSGSGEADSVDPVALLSSAGSGNAPGAAAPTSSTTPGASRGRTDPMAMLRALAAADAKNPATESVAAAAARLAPVVVSTSSTAASSSAASLNVSTSRRTEAPTPRRPGVTPRRAGILGSGTTPKR